MFLVNNMFLIAHYIASLPNPPTPPSPPTVTFIDPYTLQLELCCIYNLSKWQKMQS